MPRQVDEYQAKVTVDTGDSERKVTTLGREIDDLTKHPYDIKIETNADASVDDINALGKEIQEVAQKAAALGQETVTVRLSSDNIDQVKRDFQTLGNEITEIDNKTIDVKFNTGELAQAGQQIESVGTRFGQLKEKARGLFDQFGGTGKLGSSLQDLSGLLGTFGGQLGDLGAAASTFLGTFAGLGAGAAGLGAVIVPVLGALSQMGQDAKIVAQATDELTRSLIAAKEAASDIVDTKIDSTIKDWGSEFFDFNLTTKQLGTGITGTTEDFLKFYNAIGAGLDVSKGADDSISKMNTTIRTFAATQREAFTQAAAKAVSYGIATGSLTAAQIEAANAATLTADQQAQLNQQLSDGVLTADEVKAATFSYQTVLDNTTAAIGQMTDAQKQQATQADALVKGLEQQAAAAAKIKQNLAGLKGAAEDMVDGWDHATAAAKGFGDVFGAQRSQLFDIHTTYASVATSLGDLFKQMADASPAFKGTNEHLTTFSEEGRKMIETLEGLNTQIGTNFQAILQSGGTYDDVRAKAASYREEIEKQMTALGITTDEQQAYLVQLGLTPDQIETTIKLTGQEEAKQQLQLLQQFTTDLPPEVKTEYVAAVKAGDYEKAVNLLLAAADVPPIVYDTEIGDNQAEVTLQKLTNGDYEAQVDIDGEAATFDVTMAEIENGSFESTVKINGNDVPVRGTIRQVEGGGYQATVAVVANTRPWYEGVSKLSGTTVTVNVKPNFIGGIQSFFMAGGPVTRDTIARVGEAGAETVLLPKGAYVRTAGQTLVAESQSGGGTTHIHYHNNITVNVPLGGNPVAVGRAIQDTLDAFERSSGTRKRRIA